MSRFSTTKQGSKTKTVNVAGGEAFKESPKLELVSTLLTSFLTDKHYESADNTISRIKGLVTGIKDKLFVAKSAIYARTKFGMRSVSHVVAAEIAKEVKGEEWTKRFFDKVVYRPDDMSEILAYYIENYDKPIPNSLKKGLAKAFDKFDGYQLGKYRGETHEISLVDVVNLVHPKPTTKNVKALEGLIKGTLVSKDTWEKELTQAGQKAKTEEEKEELKADVWKKLIKERKIGYFALLRNLRNIIEQAPEMVDEACALLVDEKLIKNSLVLPFRYSTALKEIEQLSGKESRKVIRALNDALEVSCVNVPKFDGDTLVVVDCSGSMEGKPAEIAGLFGAILSKYNDADLMVFSDNARYKTVNTADSVLTIAKSITNACGGTNFHAIFEKANKKYDRIIILSDMQGWVGYDAPTKTFTSYKQRYGANSKIYSFNLNDYGTLEFPEKDVYCIAGFSEKIFDVMKLLEQDRQALISEIEKVVI